MNETIQILTSIGLTSTEASIYLSGLGNESVDVKEIGKKTSIKRPTIYHALNTLIEKGLVAERKIGNKVTFSMCPPKQIKSYVNRQKEKLAEQEKRLEGIVPLLDQQISNDKKGKFTIVEYKGIEGVKMVLDTAFYCTSRHWDIIAPVNNFLREYDKKYSEYYLRAREYNNITARSLWEHKPGARKLTREEMRSRNPRFMPKNMQGRFQSMIILFDDKVAIISPLEKLSAALITSKEMNGMFTAMFDGIWEISEKYR